MDVDIGEWPQLTNGFVLYIIKYNLVYTKCNLYITTILCSCIQVIEQAT